ncbi:MAG: hypothetical protein H6712_20320 [Myxococcales bacterium]|nr:hypothetical protein [Myxococcales bacterium]
MEEHPLRAALAVDPDRWGSLPAALRGAILRLFEQSPARSAGRDLGRLVSTPWFSALTPEDRLRAVKVVAALSAGQEGWRPSEGPLCARRIIANTLGALLGPDAPFSLSFEALPAGDEGVVAGLRRAPGTVVLNRRAIAADDRRLGLGSPIERRVGTCTLVHEVNHLCNPTVVGPSYEAFMDEYRAWMVDYLVFAGRPPAAAAGLERCQQVLTRPAYAAIGRLLEHEPERARVLAFLRRFGAFATVEEALVGPGGDLVAAAPLPDPPGNLDNDATARAAPRA